MSTETATREQVADWIAQYVEALNANWQREVAERYDGNPLLAADRYEVNPGGKKYARILRVRPGIAGGSAEAFVDLATGDVFKPDGWKRPAKGLRFRLADPESRERLLQVAGRSHYLYR